MSKTRKVRDIVGSLTKKGFVKKEGGNHTKLIYSSKNKKQPIYTIISRGKKEYGIQLLDKMASQLNLTNSQLLEFIDCDISKKEYNSIQVMRGSVTK